MRHSIWELELPAEFVAREPQFRSFLERRACIREITSQNSGMVDLVRLMVGQGCVTYDGTKDAYSLTELDYVFRALIFRWYGGYYAHPFWNKLNSCQVSIPQLFGWMLRTYHLSRSAGMTAARGSVYSTSPAARATFFKSAIEEYSHCEDYYLPKHPVFGLDERWIKKLIPFAASTAFDQQMATIAEDDWLAHAMVAFFQEYTAAFREDSFRLYDMLSAAYGLGDFFDGWKRHIGYDVNHNHAEEFEELLSGVESFPRSSILCSFDAAAMTVEYLIAALDELLSIGTAVDLREFRVSPELATAGATRTTLLGGVLLEAVNGKSNWNEICNTVVHIVSDAAGSRKKEILGAIRRTLAGSELIHLLLRALARCYEHDQIMLIGAILEIADRDLSARSITPSFSGSIGERALNNFLRECSTQSKDFTFLLLICSKLARQSDSGDESESNILDRIGRIIENHLVTTGAEDWPRVAALGIQFGELCTSASGWKRKMPDQDVLLTEPPPAISFDIASQS